MAKIETPCICTIKIDNKEIKHTVSLVQLNQRIHDHHELQVRIKQIGEDSARSDFNDPASFTGFLGKAIAVSITPAGDIIDSSQELEFIGLVTDIKLENSIDGLNTVLLVAKSPTIAMDGAKQVTFFQDQSASDIISSIVGNFPISRGTMESSGSTMKYSVQYRETDWQYVKRLGEGSGMFAYYDGKEFILQKATGSSSVELVWRRSLGMFSLGLGTASSKYQSKSWNYGTKTALEGQADTSVLRSTPSDLTKVSIDASKKVFSRAEYHSTGQAADQASVDASLAKRVQTQIGQMVKCSGESIVPSVKVGHCVKITGMDQIDGLYWVLDVTHVFDDSGKYHNEFVCSPLDISFPSSSTSRPSLTNLQSGIVTDLADPDALGRIKVKIPALGIETLWVRYVWPHAGNNHGWVTLPEVDDEVLVGWENGSPDLPIALGSIYSGTDGLPVAPDDKNEVKVFLTRGGNEIRLTDKDGEEEIKVSTKDGENSIVLSMKKPSISITSKGDVSIESTGDLSIKGKNVKIESDSATDLKAGGDLNLEATANMKNKAGANLNVEASAQCVIKGAIINLN